MFVAICLGCNNIPAKCLAQSVCLALDLEDLDGAVGRAGREAATVVVKDSIVLTALLAYIDSIEAARIEEALQVKVDVRSYHRVRSW